MTEYALSVRFIGGIEDGDLKAVSMPIPETWSAVHGEKVYHYDLEYYLVRGNPNMIPRYVYRGEEILNSGKEDDMGLRKHGAGEIIGTENDESVAQDQDEQALQDEEG